MKTSNIKFIKKTDHGALFINNKGRRSDLDLASIWKCIRLKISKGIDISELIKALIAIFPMYRFYNCRDETTWPSSDISPSGCPWVGTNGKEFFSNGIAGCHIASLYADPSDLKDISQ